mmetsp:Transcript_38174/g.80234  ORF Transcript_38174/g.80234 Transcript_38174/m.80234 type:complete len:282 (-) Transcript_38174:106-951(-)
MARLTGRLLTRAAEVTGVGLHCGERCHVRLLPARIHDGIHFVRLDQGAARINAHVDFAEQSRLNTTLQSASGVRVRTVEHLMAALVNSNIAACRIEMDAPELPILDGSASPWMEAVFTAEPVSTDVELRRPRVTKPLRVEQGDSWVLALPSAVPKITCGIDFPFHAPIARQWHTFFPEAGRFDRDIAPARTFALQEHIDAMQRDGLIKGGSLECALVCDRERWVNGPLRFPNEPVRHKLLDLLGDLALAGPLPAAHVIAYKASHALHVRIAAEIHRHQAFA